MISGTANVFVINVPAKWLLYIQFNTLSLHTYTIFLMISSCCASIMNNSDHDQDRKLPYPGTTWSKTEELVHQKSCTSCQAFMLSESAYPQHEVQK